MEHGTTSTLTGGPASFDGCVTHGRKCARPNVESFSDNDLRSFRQFCGAFLGVLLKPAETTSAPSAACDPFDRS